MGMVPQKNQKTVQLVGWTFFNFFLWGHVHFLKSYFLKQSIFSNQIRSQDLSQDLSQKCDTSGYYLDHCGGSPGGEHSALSSDHLLRILGTNPVANPVANPGANPGANPVTWKSPFVEVPKLEVLGFVDTFIVDRSGPYFILLFTHIGEQKALVCARSDHYYCVNESQNHQFRDLSFETVFSNENHKYYKKKNPRVVRLWVVTDWLGPMWNNILI